MIDELFLFSEYHHYILPLADVAALLCGYNALKGGGLSWLALKPLRVSLICITIYAQKCCVYRFENHVYHYTVIQQRMKLRRKVAWLRMTDKFGLNWRLQFLGREV